MDYKFAFDFLITFLMKRLFINIFILTLFFLSTNNSFAESRKTIVKDSRFNSLTNTWRQVKDWCLDNKVADKLDAGFSLSSMGIGLEVKTRATKWAEIRTGVDWFPRFNVPLSFDLNTYSEGIPTGNFNHVAELLYDMTGIEMDEIVHMNGRGSMVNFKFMVDIFPVPENRHWRVTAGFYAGTSMIARTANTYEEKPTLVGLNIYNRAYEYFTNLQSIFDVPLGGGNYMDPELVQKLQTRFREYGRMGIHIGDFKDGTPYIMDPAPDGSISAKALVNRFKPYLGAGYSTDLDRDKKWHLGVDLGVVFWGGSPKVINHDYNTGKNIDFTRDLINLSGKVSDYVKICKAFPVYPMVAVRISYSIL